MFLRFNYSKAMILAAATSSAAAFAQAPAVSSTKVAKSLPDLVSSQSASLEYRNYLNRNKLGNGNETNQVVNQARAYIGVNTFNDKVSTLAIFGASTLSGGKSSIKQRQPQIVTEVEAFDSKYFSLKPYVDIRTPQKNSDFDGTKVELGLMPQVKYPAVATAVGDLTATFTVEADALFFSRKQDSAVKSNASLDRQRALGLVAATEKEPSKRKEAKSTSYEVLYYPEVKLSLSKVVPGLGLSAMVEYNNSYDAYIEVVDNGVDAPATEKTGYEITRSTDTYLGISYKVNDQLTIKNDFVFGNSDFYGAAGDADGVKFSNLARLSYTLF